MKFIKINLMRSMVSLAAVLLLLTGCEEYYKLELPLAVNQNKLQLEIPEGKTNYMVFANGKWTATLAEKQDWCTITQGSGSGNGQFFVNYKENFGIARVARVNIVKDDLTIEVVITQKGPVEKAEISFSTETMSVPMPQQIVIPEFSTNLTNAKDQLGYRLTYVDSKGVTITPEVEWVSDIMLTGEKVSLAVAPNTTDAARYARFEVYVQDDVNDVEISDAITLTQTTEKGAMTFPVSEFQYSSLKQTVTVPWQTNLTMLLDKIKSEVKEPGQQGWVSNITLGVDGITLDLAENQSSVSRNATLQFSYADEYGSECSATLQVKQLRPALEYTFAQLRNMLSSSGKTTLTSDHPFDFIRGVVVSDAENKNLETNLTSKNCYTIDYTMNAQTIYIQDQKGKYGFRVQLKPGQSNTYKRYSLVDIYINDLVLEREDEPCRYTLSGLDKSQVGAYDDSKSYEVVKDRTIQTLTDDDLYTCVRLKDVELASSLGTWFNANDVFMVKGANSAVGGANGQIGISSADCCPRYLHDAAGSDISMLINAQVPWRKEGTTDPESGRAVPRGKGDVTGVVVHTLVYAYGYKGNVGRYSIRPLHRQDIALDENNGFSAILAEWNWNQQTGNNAQGSKVYSTSGQSSANISNTLGIVPRAKLARDFTLLHYKNGQDDYGSVCWIAKSNAWWNFTQKTGGAMDINFSTEGLSGRSLNVAFTCAIGTQSPNNWIMPNLWNVLYSTDGVHFTHLDKIALHLFFHSNYVKIHGAFYLLPPGFPEYIFKLPAECFGKDKVILRLQAAGPYYTKGNNMPGVDGEDTYPADTKHDGYFNFGSVTIKYN